MEIKKYRVHEAGLNRFFGPLEAKIMDIVWASEIISAKEVHSRLNSESPISFNAVMTVMNRLGEKGYLRKQVLDKGGRRLVHFQAVMSKEQFLEEQTKTVTFGLIEEFGDLVVNHFVEALKDADPELLRKLEQKINEMKVRKQR